MEERAVLSKKSLWNDFALEEFRALNEEILERVRRQNTFVGFSLLIGTGLISAVNIWDDIYQAVLVALAISFILWIILLVFIEQDYQVALIGNYILTHIYPFYNISTLGKSPGWELYRGERLRRLGIGIKLSMVAKYAFLLAPMLVIDIWIIPLTGKNLTFSFFSLVSIVFILGLCIKYILTILAFRETMREYFPNDNRSKKIKTK